jgi:anti-sigma B factor antagonist
VCRAVPFRCDVDPDRASVFVRPVGELDVATAPIVDAQLAELAAAGFTSFVLDLRGLQFLDSSGLRLVLSWGAKAGADGRDVSVIPGPAHVQRVFEVAGVTDLLSFSPAASASWGR